jgi:hypothetical protein
MKLTINNVEREVEASPDMPLLWVLRDLVGLTGTKTPRRRPPRAGWQRRVPVGQAAATG